ncbi:hypothetical protein NECAME_13693 [Necator americanus]|uniref:Uncharacterized protein n=1 Tax=Necator americanus TaxID=51031 RepID=W2SVR7_NECAM|nr:hypothetical protein NECAME_13693 [Necator americanus]ETN72911.1 hypothetical protein NECAME_13693 [Necator americanus]
MYDSGLGQCGAGGGGGGFRHINESVLNELEEIPFLADGRRTPSAATKEMEGNAKKRTEYHTAVKFAGIQGHGFCGYS